MVVSHIAVKTWLNRLEKGKNGFETIDRNLNDFFRLFFQEGDKIDIYTIALFCALSYLDTREASFLEWLPFELYVTDKGKLAIERSREID